MSMNRKKIYNSLVNHFREQKRNLSKEEKLFCINYIKNIPDNILNKFDYQLIAKKISDIIINKSKQSNFDLKKYYMKILSKNTSEEIKKSNGHDVQEFLGYNDYDKFLKSIVPQLFYKKYYILFDSKNRIRDSETNDLSWYYMPNKHISNNSVTTNGNLSNIVSMKIYQGLLPNMNYTNINLQNRISLFIKELIAQSALVGEDTRYHFVGRIVELTSTYRTHLHFDDDTYDFYQPIQSIDKFTIQLKTPNRQLTLNQDIITCTLTYGAVTTFTSIVQHNSASLHYVYITGFTTDDPATDRETINLINRKEGHKITRIDNFSFYIDVDTQTITPTANLSVSVYLGSQRLIIPMEFTCLN